MCMAPLLPLRAVAFNGKEDKCSGVRSLHSSEEKGTWKRKEHGRDWEERLRGSEGKGTEEER